MMRFLSDIDQAEIGFKTNAIVEKFVPNGCIVSFFGNLKAFYLKLKFQKLLFKMLVVI